MSPSDDLAAQLSPALQAAWVANREKILDASGGALTRWAMRIAFPIVEEWIPVFASVALDFIAIQFGNWTLNDVLAWITTRKAQIAARPR